MAEKVRKAKDQTVFPENAKKQDSKTSDVQKKSRKVSKKTGVTILLVILLIASAACAFIFYKKYQDVKNNPTAAINEKNTAETEKVLTQVKGLILIETTEQPTVARVENPDTLKKNNEVFYKNIQKGDYLILFKDRAIIYRQSNNQIINIAPIVSTPEQPAAQQNTQNNSTNTNTRR